MIGRAAALGIALALTAPLPAQACSCLPDDTRPAFLPIAPAPSDTWVWQRQSLSERLADESLTRAAGKCAPATPCAPGDPLCDGTPRCPPLAASDRVYLLVPAGGGEAVEADLRDAPFPEIGYRAFVPRHPLSPGRWELRAALRDRRDVSVSMHAFEVTGGTTPPPTAPRVLPGPWLIEPEPPGPDPSSECVCPSGGPRLTVRLEAGQSQAPLAVTIAGAGTGLVLPNADGSADIGRRASGVHFECRSAELTLRALSFAGAVSAPVTTRVQCRSAGGTRTWLFVSAGAVVVGLAGAVIAVRRRQRRAG